MVKQSTTLQMTLKITQRQQIIKVVLKQHLIQIRLCVSILTKSFLFILHLFLLSFLDASALYTLHTKHRNFVY